MLWKGNRDTDKWEKQKSSAYLNCILSLWLRKVCLLERKSCHIYFSNPPDCGGGWCSREIIGECFINAILYCIRLAQVRKRINLAGSESVAYLNWIREGEKCQGYQEPNHWLTPLCSLSLCHERRSRERPRNEKVNSICIIVGRRLDAILLFLCTIAADQSQQARQWPGGGTTLLGQTKEWISHKNQ